MASFQMTCARTEQPCGCVTWLQWDDGQDAWVAQAHHCHRHQD